MKRFLFVLLSVISTLAVTAQTITITFNGTNGNRNYQAVLDGTSYYSNSVTDPNTTTTSVSKTITIEGQSVGSHTLAIYRMRSNSSVYTNGTNTSPNGRALYSNSFNLRQGYDMDIAVNGNGVVTFSERRIRNQGRRGNNNTVSPMTGANFDNLLQSVRSKWMQSSKVTVERDAFNNTANYFTTDQVRQLLLLITSEANRLALAKLAYPRATDPSGYTQLYDLFNSTASRNDLAAYMRNNPNNNNTGRWNNNNNNNNNSYRTPMADYQFSQLVQTVNSQYNQSVKYATISGSFNNSNNYFTTAQIRQLLSLINSEDNRLALAKQSYLRVTDAANFSTLYDLFYSQSSRNELNNYVMQNGGTVSNNPNGTRTATADYQFTQLLQTVNSQYGQSGKYTAISGAFNNSYNYFSTYQLRQLISIINTEGDRLSLLKLAYARSAEPSGFSSLYDLLYNQSSRNELNNYVIANGGNGSNVQYTNRIAMSDADFTSVLQKVSNHFLPWDKVRDAKAAFSNTAYYFNTSQIRQVLTVITSESDRLELAKLAWNRVTDPAYFTSLFDMFTSQANRDELNVYIQAHPF